MKAIGHLATGAAVALAADTTIKNLAYSSGPLGNAAATLSDSSFFAAPHISGAAGIAIFSALYFLGLLLPDCDNAESFISKIIYIPVGHRTWTHSIWPILCLFILGIFWHPITGLAFGMLIHIFFDALSVSGICWLYPLTKYRDNIKSGIKPDKYTTGYEAVSAEELDREVPPGWHADVETNHVNPNHRVKLYNTKKKGSVIVIIAIVWILALLYYLLSASVLWHLF